MKLCALLMLCGIACLGETTPAHSVQQRSSNPTEDRAVRVQMEVDAAEPWSLTVGESVQIRCFLSTDSDQDKAKKLKLNLLQIEEGSIQILTTEPVPASKGISYTLGPVTLRDRGLYTCEFDKSNPHITVEDAHKLIWVNDSSPVVSLKLLRVNRVKYFHDKTLTIGCQLPNDNSEWRIMRASEKTGSTNECSNQERTGDLLSCTIPSLPPPVSESQTYDAFWCESSSIQKSNILNVTEAESTERNARDVLVTGFDVTPAWFVREGDSMGFQCYVRFDHNNNNDKCDLQLIWTKMGPGNDMTVLKSQRATEQISYTLNNITHEHSGVYTCWDDGTLSNVFAHPWHHFIWVQDDSPPVTINVLSHNRTQFFHNEEVTMGCQLPNDQSQWTLKGFDKWTGIIKKCDKPELSSSGLLSCTVKMGYPWTHYLFWCESTTGLRSNVLNMTNIVGYLVLEAPPLPVMEGDNLTLRCLRKNQETGEITADKASFGHNSLIFDVSDVGSITLTNVTKEREGLYNCQLKDGVSTLSTYVTVKARPQ